MRTPRRVTIAPIGTPERILKPAMSFLLLVTTGFWPAILVRSPTALSMTFLSETASLNMGVSEAVSDKKIMDNAVGDLTKIAGQKPVVTKSKKDIAGFKIRSGVPIGAMVTLRGVRMYEFLDRFVTVALPRVRDFRGISGRSFDGRGNYNVGVKEQIIFPEVDYDKVDALRGMNISITTSAKTDDECKALLTAFRFPFKN